MVLAFTMAAPQAEVIGHNTPVTPLTEARIQKEVPAEQRGAWIEYLHRSAQQMSSDKAALAKERAGLAELPPLPLQGYSARALPLDRDAAFYRSAEARRTGEILLSFQTPAGGWSKNLRFNEPRQRGQAYATGNAAPTPPKPDDFDAPHDVHWHYIGTLDNDATNTELHFLAKLAAAWPGHEGDAFRAAFLRGVEYLLKAQYPNGGWPQVYPLEGGYHDAITFNDDAETESAELLSNVARGADVKNEAGAAETFAFVPVELRTRAQRAVDKALECILRAQVRVPAAAARVPGHASGEVLTVWAQQYDPLTLEPCSARNYEMRSLAAGESASAVEYLMSLPHPNAPIVAAVDAAVLWFRAHQINGYAWTGGRNTPGGRRLVAEAGAGPLWPRYTALTTGLPIFGDRDKTIHDDVMELSLERRNGYAWYGEAPKHVLDEYAAWKRRAGTAAASYAK